MRNLSNWRSVRVWEHRLRDELQDRYALWLHGWCIGVVVFGVMWAASHLQMVLGSHPLALRYGVTLGIGYLAYLVVLRLWAAALLARESSGDPGLHVDVPSFGSGGGEAPAVRIPGDTVPIQSGGGGDFAGGGATGDFDMEVPEAGSALAEAVGGALEVAGGADEGAVVVIPVVVVFLAGIALLFGAGSILWLYFGFEALLAVAVEVAFGYVSASTAVKVARKGWLGAAVRLTWKPLLGALAVAVILGALIDQFLPQARSLPHAIKLLTQ